MERTYKRKRMRKGRRKNSKKLRIKRAIRRLILLIPVALAVFCLVIFLKSTIFSRVYKECKVEAGIEVDAQDFMKSNDYKGEFTDKSDKLDTSITGEYTLYIKSGWFTYKTKLIVEDTVAPEGVLRDVTTMVNKSVKPEDFFSEIVDGTKVSVSFVKEPSYDSYGEEEVELVLKDLADNQRKYNGKLIISPIYPEITVEAGNEIPNISDFLPDEYNEVGIENLNINEGLPNENSEVELIINEEIDMNTVADYEAEVMFMGTNWKSIIHVRDTIPPVVEVKSVTVFQASSKINAQDFVKTLEDVTSASVSFESEPDVLSLGNKEVTIVVTDEGGNVTKKHAELKVVKDEEAPKIFGADNISIQVGGSISYKKNITVIDNCDEDVEFQVDSSKVNLGKIGSYDVVYTAVDKAGNKAETIITVSVVEEEVPTEEMVNELADNILDIIISSDMTEYGKAEAIFRWVHDKIGYVDIAPKNNWIDGAYRGLKDRRGDCYTYAMTSKILLTRAGITNIDIKKVPDKKSHYWNLIDIGDGWYHFDATRRSDGTEFFYVRDEVIWEYSNSHYDSHKFDPSLYPTIN